MNIIHHLYGSLSHVHVGEEGNILMLMITLTSLILTLLPSFLSRDSFLLVRPSGLKALSDLKMYYSDSLCISREL